MIKDKLKKLLSVEGIFVLLLFILFCYLFVENFVFSESYEMTQFRLCDDEDFNQCLYTWHCALKQLDFHKVFCFNDFYYGWIFWAFHGIITFPFFLSGMETMILSTLRTLSLIMTFASLYFIYKILGYYTKNKYYKLLVIISILSCNTFIFYSLTFDTTAMIRFFGILSIYFILKDKNLSIKTIILSSICLGICITTKNAGITFLPVVVLLFFDRLIRNNEKNKIFKSIFIFFLFFIFSMLFFNNPSFFLPVNLSDSNNSAIQTFYFSFNEEYKEIIFRLTDTFYGFLTTVFLCLLYISHIIRNSKNKNYDFIYYAAGLTVLPIMSLCIKSTDIPLYWIKHFSIILPLLAFSFIELENYKKVGFYASIAVLILILSRALIFQRSFSPVGMLQSINNKYLQINMYYAEKEYWTKINRFTLFEDLKEIVKPNKDGIISFCSHYDSSVRPYFMYRPNVVSKRFFYKNFDNSDEYDYYILSKPVQEDEIPKFYYLIEQFENREIGNSRYTKIYDKYDTVVYKKDEQ